MMDIIIFSRNRPMQLHCLLESIETNYMGVYSVYVLYRADMPTAMAGYDKMHDIAEFYEEADFKADFERIVDLCGEYVTLFVDDDIVFGKVSTIKIDEAMCDDVDIVSLRLGGNIRNKKHFQVKGSLDGNVYKKHQLREVFAHDFSNPNKLEIALSKVMKERTMGWFSYPRVIGIPANRVSDTSGCDHMGIDLNEMNERYLAGWRIDWERMDLYSPDVHKMEPYVYRLANT